MMVPDSALKAQTLLLNAALAFGDAPSPESRRVLTEAALHYHDEHRVLQMNARHDATIEAPDAHLEAEYEARTELADHEEAP